MFPSSSNLVHLRAFTETLCDNPSLLEGRLFRRDGILYSVTGIDARTGIARLSADANRQFGLAIEHLILAEVLADLGLTSTPAVSVSGVKPRRARVIASLVGGR